MPDKTRHIIPDKKVNAKTDSPEQKKAVVTDIDSLIEPPKPARDLNINAAAIEKAVRSADIPMILMIFVMIVFGLVILYSVSAPDAYGQFQDSSWFLTRQIRFTLVGLVLMFIVSFIPVDFFAQKWIAVSSYVLSFGLAVATLALGVGREHGASRWINIGPIQLQSSEIIKVALIVAFAGYRAMVAKLKAEGKMREPKSHLMRIIKHIAVDFIIPVTLAIVVDVVIVMQPHVSCFIIIGAVIFMCALVSEIPLKSWVIGGLTLLLVGGAAGAMVLALMPASSRDRIMKNYAHVFKRIQIFNADEEEEEEESTLTKDDTRQVDNAHNALGSGGMWGVGLGNSRSKYNYVSEAQNDYIFSIYVEETGFVGGVLLMLMYLVMFLMCLRVCWRAKDVFSRTIATGCTALIFVEVLMNFSVELQIIPSTGVTLPFVSYGGTAQISLLIAYGFIMSVSRSGTLRPSTKKEKLDARAKVKAVKTGA